MTAIAAFLGALTGSMLVNVLNRRKRSEIMGLPGTGTMKDHVYVDPVKKKSVYRDKEIEREEELLRT